MSTSVLLPRRTDLPRLVLLALAYAALAVLGLNWGVYRGAGTAVWPAAGLAFAALLLGGTRLWPGIFIGRLLAASVVGSATPLWADLVIALASTVSIALPVVVMTTKGRLDPALRSMRDVAVLIVGVFVGGAISATIGIAAVVASGHGSPQISLAFTAWFLGFVSSTLVITPLLLSWTLTKPSLSRAQVGKLIGGVLLSVAAAVVVLFELTPLHLRTWHLFPILAAIAILFSVRGISLAMLATAVVALFSVSYGVGPLSEIFQGAAARALYAQEFIGLTGGTLLFLAAATDESRSKSAIANAQATKAAVFDAALDAIITMNADGRVVDWNNEAERMFGLPRALAVGSDLADLIVPEPLRERHRQGLARYGQTGASNILGRRLELEALRNNGETFPIELAINAITLEDRPHFTAYARDLTAQVEARALLRDQDQRLRATYEHAPVGIAEVGLDGRILKVNEQFCAITGRDRAELLDMTIWDDPTPALNGEEHALFTRQMRGELDSYTLEKPFRRGNGEAGWMELRATRVDDTRGRPIYGVRVVRDITQEKVWARQQALLINELNHRVKNTLASVQSITYQTLRNGGAEPSLQAAVEDRLIALSRAHDVLTRRNWEGADLAEIITVAASAYVVGQDARLTTSGPEIRLAPQVALGLAMALQELATNALKHGAWSNSEGIVAITWTLTESSPPYLDLTWLERGGPQVAAPTRKGFGMRLLERNVGADINGTCKLDFRPEGLVCRIHAIVD